VIEIDGSRHSGSGTIVRYAAALATLLSEPVRIRRIRAGRDKPGLRPQHLTALKACASLCRGRLEGAAVGSDQVQYWPGSRIEGGAYRWDIGTAGSATMLAFTLIPPALFAVRGTRLLLTGGLFQDHAPTLFHTQHVLVPMLRQMGADVRLRMHRPGYVPKGQGLLEVQVNPRTRPLRPLALTTPGTTRAVRGLALASHLAEAQVSRRMAERCAELLAKDGHPTEIETHDDTSAVQKGAALTVWAETSGGCRIGADQAGKPGRASESIAEFVARTLLEDLRSGAATDRHLADQLIFFAALARGRTDYLVPRHTDHIESNLWLVQTLLGANARLDGNHLGIEGISLLPRRSHGTTTREKGTDYEDSPENQRNL
jgi:RNA 3'-terminal phosphate cyclase (ATP)